MRRDAVFHRVVVAWWIACSIVAPALAHPRCPQGPGKRPYVYKLRVEHDRKKDISRVATEVMFVQSATPYHDYAELTAEFSFRGRQVTSYPDVVRVNVFTHGVEGDFLRRSKETAAYVEIGDVRVHIGDRVLRYPTEYNAPREFAMINVPVKALAELFTRAPDDVEGRLRVGKAAFKLSPPKVADLRAFYLVAAGALPLPTNE
jgi:hypothetical protein